MSIREIILFILLVDFVMLIAVISGAIHLAQIRKHLFVLEYNATGKHPDQVR